MGELSPRFARNSSSVVFPLLALVELPDPRLLILGTLLSAFMAFLPENKKPEIAQAKSQAISS
jgi:hypothetical protein